MSDCCSAIEYSYQENKVTTRTYRRVRGDNTLGGTDMLAIAERRAEKDN